MYYKEMEKYLPGRVALLISDPSRKDASELWELKELFKDEDKIIKQFKYEDVDKLAMIIVVDKYLTGLDALIERVLYLDKPLKEHTLLQAIARVNRPLPEKDKQWGLIVDYWGVSSFLDKALETFDADLHVSEVMNKRSDDVAFEELQKCRKDVFACFPPDLSKDNIGKRKFGVEIWDGGRRTEDLIKVSDVIIFTGTTLVNDTFTQIWNLIQSRQKKYLVYGVTAAGVCQLLGIDRICPRGRDGLDLA